MRSMRVTTFALTAFAIASLVVLLTSTPLLADQSKGSAKASAQVYMLNCPSGDESVWKLPATGLHWQTLHKMLDEKAGKLIKVADREDIDPLCYLETEGLRLYVASVEGRDRFQNLPAESSEQITLAYLVRTLLQRRYSATGIEPDRIPVNGEQGKTLRTEGMVRIKEGEYLRSGHYYTSQSAELGERTGDKYVVKVPAFYIDKFKVTNEQYCRFLNDGNPGYWNSAPWSNIRRREDGRFVVDGDKAKWPVIAVNWYQAAGYAEWAGKRLPTEAEWEFAAGGAEGRKYPWGNEAPDQTRASVYVQPYAPVDALPLGATPDGVFDLAGNAAEWCADYFDFAYYETAPSDGVLVNPQGPLQGNPNHGYARMFKGFCHGADRHPEFLECTKRHARAPLLTAAIGFRCVKDCDSP